MSGDYRFWTNGVVGDRLTRCLYYIIPERGFVQIEHIALWTQQLDQLKTFYETYFQAQAGSRYHNPTTNFESYFLTFPSGGCRVELMYKPNLCSAEHDSASNVGLAHFAFAVGSKEVVHALTNRLEHDGYTVVSRPRTTGDGYYESCVLDPDGNKIEITV